MRILIAVSFVFSFQAPAFCRLFESKEECIQRYGEPARKQEIESPQGELIYWVKAGIEIYASFPNSQEKCLSIMFTAVGGRTLSKEEQEEILWKNSKGRRWIRVVARAGTTLYKTEDGRIVATYDSIHDTLLMVTAEYSELEKADQRKKLKDF